MGFPREAHASAFEDGTRRKESEAIGASLRGARKLCFRHESEVSNISWRLYMENARQLFGKLGQIRANATESTNVGSGSIVSRAGAWWFKLMLVMVASAIVILALCSMVIVSPLILVYALWTYEKGEKQTKQSQAHKSADRWQSGKSVDEILGVC